MSWDDLEKMHKARNAWLEGGGPKTTDLVGEAFSAGYWARIVVAAAERAAPAPVALSPAQPLSEAAINSIISQHEVYEYHPGALLEFSRAIIKAATGQEGGAA